MSSTGRFLMQARFETLSRDSDWPSNPSFPTDGHEPVQVLRFLQMAGDSRSELSVTYRLTSTLVTNVGEDPMDGRTQRVSVCSQYGSNHQTKEEVETCSRR